MDKTPQVNETAAECSLFSHYVTAAFIAARMGIGLGYAFDKYVKPKIPKSGVVNFTPEEAESMFRMVGE